MQAAKDTFYCTLRDRLAAERPEWTMSLDGVERPAVMVCENERAHEEDPTGVYCLEWSAAKSADGRTDGLQAMVCSVTYAAGDAQMTGALSRGRALGMMEQTLRSICTPNVMDKCAYDGDAPKPLGTKVFWTLPVAGEKSEDNGALRWSADVTVYFHAEAE